MKRKYSIATALAVTAGSAVAATVIRKRRTRPRLQAGLYFEDGSMLSLPESSPHAEPLLELAREAVSVARAR